MIVFRTISERLFFPTIKQKLAHKTVWSINIDNKFNGIEPIESVINHISKDVRYSILCGEVYIAISYLDWF